MQKQNEKLLYLRFFTLLTLFAGQMVFGTDTEVVNISSNDDLPGSLEIDAHIKAVRQSQYNITIPKTIILDGSKGSDNVGEYSVSVSGDISTKETITIKPQSNPDAVNGGGPAFSTDTPQFYLGQKGKSDVVATIVQNKTSWAWDDISSTEPATTTGTISANISAGSWAGHFDFEVSFDTNIEGDNIVDDTGNGDGTGNDSADGSITGPVDTPSDGSIDDTGNDSTNDSVTAAYNFIRSSANETTINDSFLNSPIPRAWIECVKFSNDMTIPAEAIEVWDVSEKEDGSIMAYYTNLDFDGGYEVTICSKLPIYANEDSSYLFANIGHCGDDPVGVYNLELLNTSQVKNASYMFYSFGYEGLRDFSLGGNFDTSNVTNMEWMFYQCGNKYMTELDLGDKFDTSNVLTMSNMFNNCGYESLKKINFRDKFDTSSVVDMSGMFYQCGAKSLISLNLGDNFNTSSVLDMSNMFYQCGIETISSLDLGDKFYTHNTKNMSGMFYMFGTKCLEVLNLGDKFDTSNVIDMSYMFYMTGCQSMKTLNLGDNFNTENVVNMSNMFYMTGTNSMSELNLGDKFITTNVMDMSYLFYMCGAWSMERFYLGDFCPNDTVRNDSSLYYGIFSNCGRWDRQIYTKNVDVANWMKTLSWEHKSVPNDSIHTY